MAVRIADTLGKIGSAQYPLVNASDVWTEDGKNIEEVLESTDAEIEDLKKSVSDGKALVAGAITEKGVDTATDATFAVLAQNIADIVAGGGSGGPLKGIAWGEFTPEKDLTTVTLEYSGIEKPLAFVLYWEGFFDALNAGATNADADSGFPQIANMPYCFYGLTKQNVSSAEIRPYLISKYQTYLWGSTFPYEYDGITNESLTLKKTSKSDGYTFAAGYKYKWVVIGENYTKITTSGGSAGDEDNPDTEAFSITSWTAKAGLNYTALADISEKDMRKLMTVHASADYLVSKVGASSNVIDEFTTNQYAMKWIGLRDYVCDKLMAIDGVTDKLLASEYWEYILKDKVPVMTSNTDPYGKASTDGYYSAAYDAYKAFDNIYSSDEKGWCPDAFNRYVCYNFSSPIKVNRVSLCLIYTSAHFAVSISSSNDGINWYTLVDEYEVTTSDNKEYVSFDNDNYYLYYKITLLRSTNGYQYYSGSGWKIQFYGRSLNVSVPTMTSNTAPYGEASVNDTVFNPAYNAFDGNRDSYCNFGEQSSHTGNWIISYQFTSPIAIKQIYAKRHSTDAVSKFSVVYSDDGVAFSEGSDTVMFNEINNSNNEIYFADISENSPHKYWGFAIKEFSGSFSYVTPTICELQFYGVDYSEREFAEGSTMKYIYDHGVEMEAIAFAGTTTSNISYSTDNSQITVIDNNTSGTAYYTTVNGINLSNYSLIKIIYGDKQSGTNYIGAKPSGGTAGSAVAYKALTSPECYLYPPSIDVSSISTVQYPYIAPGSSPSTGTITITEWWLE